MSLGNYPDKYLLFNRKLSKQLSLVLQIDDIDTLFGIADTFTQIRYGDQGLVYGLPGVVYGGLRSIRQVRPYIMLDGGLTIQQRIEPEQGRGNIGVIQINLIDKNGEVSKILAPGVVVPEIMGKRARLWIGYTDTSFPEDYVLIYQGGITQCVCPPGKVQLQISDSTMKARQPIFNAQTTTLTNSLLATPGTQTVTVQNTSVLYQQILGPDGAYDPTVQTYIRIDDEIMEYAATGIISPTQLVVTRASLGSTVAAHDAGASVISNAGFGQNSEGINCIDLALKLLLSGWDGPCYENISVQSFVYDYNGHFQSDLFLLKNKDALFDLGLAVGDYFQISGATGAGNNAYGRITAIETGATDRNTVIRTDQTFTLENPSSAVASFRSQYDTFPIGCGVRCKTSEVDVPTFQSIKRTYFSVSAFSQFRAFYAAPISGLDLLASDIMLPLGCYSISRYGRISMAVTKPPLPGIGSKLIQLDSSNILNPQNITVTRATNQRSFYNQISYEYDYNVVTQAFQSIQYFVDTQSISHFEYTSPLPIQAKNVASTLGGATIAQTRGGALLTRFKKCLIWIELEVAWAVGSLIEVADIVVLVDNGTLKIMNFDTGERDLGVGLYEVVDRNYQIRDGKVRLKLLGGLGFDVDSRFGLYSPSSKVGTGSTTTNIMIVPSWGQNTLTNEVSKWSPLIGLPIQVHSSDWAVTGSTVLQSANVTGLTINPPLGFAPTSGMVVDIAPYPLDTDPRTDQYLKKLYSHLTPTVEVLSGVSTTQFTVSASGASEIIVGNDVLLRNADYSVITNEVEVLSVSGGLVTVAEPLSSAGSPVTPGTGFFVEGIGFRDGLGTYRYG